MCVSNRGQQHYIGRILGMKSCMKRRKEEKFVFGGAQRERGRETSGKSIEAIFLHLSIKTTLYTVVDLLYLPTCLMTLNIPLKGQY